jgi:hypothetical protein
MPFETLSSESRIWIFQADRKFTNEELKNIRKEADLFTEKWVSHGIKLQAAADILYDQFILLAVDESNQPASGCSIDSSTDFIKNIERKYSVNLLSRENVAFLINNRIRQFHFRDIHEAISRGTIKSNTLLFNNQVSKLGQLNSNWLIPAAESWASKYFSL